jgi:hypothetical protein
MDPIFTPTNLQDLILALDCLYDSELFDEHILNETVVAVYMDSSLQDQLHWLAKCEWDLTHAILTYVPQQMS